MRNLFVGVMTVCFRGTHLEPLEAIFIADRMWNYRKWNRVPRLGLFAFRNPLSSVSTSRWIDGI